MNMTTKKKMYIITATCIGALVLMAATIFLLHTFNDGEERRSPEELRRDISAAKSAAIKAEDAGQDAEALAAYRQARDSCKLSGDRQCVMDMQSKIDLIKASTSDQPKDMNKEQTAAPAPDPNTQKSGRPKDSSTDE